MKGSPHFSATCGGRQGGVRQQLPAEVESRGREAIAQKPEVTDAHEAFGQNMYADIPGASLHQAAG
jgi:hypothetical protein